MSRDPIAEAKRWRERAIRLRNVLLEISGGCAEPARRAADAIEYEREFSPLRPERHEAKLWTCCTNPDCERASNKPRYRVHYQPGERLRCIACAKPLPCTDKETA